MIYLASPYTHTEVDVRIMRAAQARDLVAHMTRQKHIVYSPIVHFHGVAMVHELPYEYAFWRAHSETMLERATEFHILAIPGWDTSVGVKDEHAMARYLGLPVRYWWKYRGEWKTNGEPPCG